MKKFKESIYENNYLKRYVKDEDIEKAKQIGSGSSKKFSFFCPNCKTEIIRTPHKMKTRGFNCKSCSSNISYAERLFKSILDYKKIKYKQQVKFNDCVFIQELLFDFAIYDSNGHLLYLVELQGIQHYETRKTSHWDLKTIKERDTIKKIYCKENNIPLIAIDCKKSEYNYIINSIKNTDLFYLIKGINKNDIINKTLINELPVDIDLLIKLHDKGESFLSIERKTGIKRKKIISVLKKLGKYNPRDGKSNNSVKVVCCNKKLVFNNLKDASMFVGGRNLSNISAVCRGNRNYCGELDGEKITWMYYGDYIEKYGLVGLSTYINNL